MIFYSPIRILTDFAMFLLLLLELRHCELAEMVLMLLFYLFLLVVVYFLKLEVVLLNFFRDFLECANSHFFSRLDFLLKTM